MANKQEKKENDFFVNLEQPELVRKSLLECSKETIKLLRQMKGIRTIRIEKQATTTKLDDTMKEITKLNNKLKTLLPKTTVRISGNKLDKKIPIPKKEQHEKKVQDLDKKLNYIENRLKDLGI